MIKTSCSKYSVQLKTTWGAFDYRDHMAVAVIDLYVKNILKVIKSMPTEDALAEMGWKQDKLWSEEFDLIEIFEYIGQKKLDKLIDRAFKENTKHQFGL